MSSHWLARPSKNMSFATGTSWTADRARLGKVKILSVLLCPVPAPSSLRVDRFNAARDC